MIELNSKTQQDFLNREWVQRLLDAGVDMSDAYYGIGRDKMYGNRDKIFFIHMWGMEDTESFVDKIPTYTVSELLYKIHGRLADIAKKDEVEVIDIFRYTPFASLLNKDDERRHIAASMEASYIESLASLLIQCHKKDIGIPRKDTGDISDK